MDVLRLHEELRACGLNINGVDSDGNVSWAGEPTEQEGDLAKSILAAHGTTLSADEALTLGERLKPDSPEWLAYAEVRKLPVKQQRAQRYVAATDSMFMKAFESSAGAADIEINGSTVRVPAAAKLQEWEAAKQTIRQALPYPE